MKFIKKTFSAYVSYLTWLMQVRRLAHIVHANMERLSAESPENMLTDLQHKLKKHLPEAFGGETNPCKGSLSSK